MEKLKELVMLYSGKVREIVAVVDNVCTERDRIFIRDMIMLIEKNAILTLPQKQMIDVIYESMLEAEEEEE